MRLRVNHATLTLTLTLTLFLTLFFICLMYALQGTTPTKKTEQKLPEKTGSESKKTGSETGSETKKTGSEAKRQNESEKKA